MLAVILALLLAQPPTAIELLLRQARYWQARGREDKAAEAFEKVLRSDPGEAEALGALGAQAARLGQTAKARDYLQRLKVAAPGSADARILERAIAIGPEFDRALAEARSLSHDGKTEDAAAAYRKLFGAGGPPRHLALEYYATLAGSRTGWTEARDGLNALVKENPGEPVYRLTLGRLLTYREETRREGMGLLAKLVDEGSLVEESDAALRQALLWIRLTAQDETALKDYLVRHPDDADVRKRLSEPHPDLQRQGTVAAGYEALEHSDLKEAERLFKTAKAADSSADTLVGQALVAMKREEFGKARDLFQKARELAPKRADLWEKPLRSSEFWAQMQDGRAAQAAHRDEEAEGYFTAASRTSTDERPFAEVALADLSLSRGQTDRAELRLRALLRDKPDMPEALRSLLSVLVRTDRPDEAQQINEKLRKLKPALALSPGGLDAELLRFRSAADAGRGRYDAARQALIAARSSDPQSRWVLHDLANLDLKLGDLPEAREAAQAMLKLDPSMPEARVTWIHVLADQGDDEAALAALSALPPETLTEDLSNLRPLLEVRGEAQRIVRRAAYDRRDLVRDDLLRLQQRMHGKPEVLAAVAQAWAALGEHQRAVDLMSDAVAQSGSSTTPGLKLDLAAILLKAGHESQLLALLGELDADPRLSPRERKGLADLKVAVAVRRADRLRTSGDLTAAFAQLGEPLNDMPDDPRLLCALGRIFLDGDRSQDARVLFLRILRDNPDNVEAREGAVQADVELRQLNEAQQLVDAGIERVAQEPRVHLLAARYQIRLGNDGAAMNELREARTLSASHTSPQLAGHLGRLTADSSVADIVAEGQRTFGTPAGDRSAADALLLQEEIDHEIDAIESRHTVSLSADTELRSRSGEAGMSQLTLVKAPLEASLPMGYRGRLSFKVTPVAMDAGSLDFTNLDVTRRFGTGEPPDATRSDLQLGLHDAGTEIAAGYKQDGFAVDVGTTPLGLPLKTVVGGVRLRQQLGGLGIAVEASRRAVEDSALSLGGVRDPLGGQLWGGVTRNGGRLDLGYTAASTTYFIWGGWYALVGTGVARNQQAIGGVGMEWTLLETPTLFVGAGLSATALGYQHNLRFYTLGQGGYFSPQAFVNAGVPLRIRGSLGKAHFEATAAPALNWFNEWTSPYFPLDPAQQAQRAQEVDSTGKSLQAFYPERTSTAFGFDLDARLSWQIAAPLEGGLSLVAHRGDDYSEVIGGLFLRVSFNGRTSAAELPPLRPGTSP